MTLHLSGEIDYKMFDTLIESFNNLLEEDILHIYFTSEGGLTLVKDAILDFINNNKDRIKITFYGEIFSGAMDIFLKASCEKNVLKHTRGMIHFSYQSVEVNESGNPYTPYGIFSVRELKNYHIETLKFLKSIKLTEKELSLIKEGKDVYFSHKRLLGLIKD